MIASDKEHINGSAFFSNYKLQKQVTKASEAIYRSSMK